MNRALLGVVGAALAATLATAPGLARAQAMRERLEDDARTQLEPDARGALADVEAQAELAGQLYVVAGIFLGVGLAAVLGGSIASFERFCAPDCTAAHGVTVGGAVLTAAGLGLFLPATVLDDDAEERRRRLLREHLVHGPALILRIEGRF